MMGSAMAVSEPARINEAAIAKEKERIKFTSGERLCKFLHICKKITNNYLSFYYLPISGGMDQRG
jgi:hypothetical protein